MISDFEIYSLARLLITLQGANAEQEVTRFIDQMRPNDTPEEQVIWQRIKTAIIEINAARRALYDCESPERRHLCRRGL